MSLFVLVTLVTFTLSVTDMPHGDNHDPHPGVVVNGGIIEEYLYAGQAETALYLVSELVDPSTDSSLVRYWTARAAWCRGESRLAVESLESVYSADRWLTFRAHGTAALYRCSPGEAQECLLASMVVAETVERKFWSGIDLCLAYLQEGSYEDALVLSSLLVNSFPNHDLAGVMYGLCLHASGGYAEAAAVLSDTYGTSEAAARLSTLLMEGFEQ